MRFLNTLASYCQLNYLEEVERKRGCADKLTNNYCCSRSQRVIAFAIEKVARRIKESEELRRLIKGWEITITASETLDACFRIT
jgi:hypothetical protein